MNNLIDMMERASSVKIGIGEFLWKLLVVFVIIVPVCVGGCFWIGVQIDAGLNIHFFKFIMPFIGSFVGFILASLLIMTGHKQETIKKEMIQLHSDRLINSHFEMMEKSKSIPSRRMIKM